MALFEKKAEKLEARDLSKIVYDMLTEGVHEDQILVTLEQAGASEEDAKNILEQAKKEYESAVGGEFQTIFENAFKKKQGEFEGFMENQIAAARKAILLQTDLNMMKQKEELQQGMQKLVGETEAIKGAITDVKLTTDSSVKRVEKEIELMKISGPARFLLTAILIITGAYLIIFASTHLFEYLPEVMQKGFEMATVLFAATVILMLLGGVILAYLGAQVYISGRRVYVAAGGEWLEKQEKK